MLGFLVREALHSIYHISYESPIRVFSSIFLERFSLPSGGLSPHSLGFALESYKLSFLCLILHISTNFTLIEHPRVLSPTSTTIAPPHVERPPPKMSSLLPSYTVAQNLKAFPLLTKPP
jgi:hypothetical protein